MRARRSVMVPTLMLGLVLTACMGGARRTTGVSVPGRGQSAASGDLLVLGSAGSITAVTSSNGHRLFSGAGVPALADWTHVFNADQSGGRTAVRAIDTQTGRVTGHVSVRGDLAIRAVSADGELAALMAPLPPGTTPWTPQERAVTDLVVTDPWGRLGGTQRFRLNGNFEPEAFSSDDQSLYMIRYVPPEHPTSYRVARLDLNRGKVTPVFGRQKTATEVMTGTRLIQVPSPKGTLLFTLYTSEPPGYAEGYDESQAEQEHPVAFVHTLNLEGGWAVCVSLPKSLWGGTPSDEALAVSPDGATLFVVDAARGVVATVDTETVSVERTAQVDFGALSGSSTAAAVSPDGGTLFVGRGASIVSVDTATLVPRQTVPVAGPVSGLGLSEDGLRLYVAMSNQVGVLDASTGRPERLIPAPGVGTIDYVGTLTA